MDYILLRNYYPFKWGQVVRLGEQTAAKLLAQGVVAPYPGPVIIPAKPKIKESVPEPKPMPETVAEVPEATAIGPVVTETKTRKAPTRAKKNGE